MRSVQGISNNKRLSGAACNALDLDGRKLKLNNLTVLLFLHVLPGCSCCHFLCDDDDLCFCLCLRFSL